ncbi:hypothetical protein Tco_1268843 [Tanacetum coccineum]
MCSITCVLVLVIPPQKTTTTTPTPLITPIPTTPIASTTQHVTSLLPVTKTLDALGPPSKALTAVLQRVSTLEKDVKKLKHVDHTAVIVESIRSQVPIASITAEEPNEEYVHKVLMDAEENIVDEMGNIEEQPNGEAAPKIDNAPKNDWFKQPPRPPTPDPE